MSESTVLPEASDINLEFGKWTRYVFGGFILFARLDYDEDPEDPHEWASFGRFYSFNRRHSNFHQPTAASREEAAEEIKEAFGEEVVFLGAFEHGQVVWHLPEERPPGTEGDYRWDGCSFAGFWVPPECVKERLDALAEDGRAEFLKDECRSALKIWNAHCNGNVCAVAMEVYKLHRALDGSPITDYRWYFREEPVGFSQLGGLYGEDGLDGGKEDVLRDALFGIEEG